MKDHEINLLFKAVEDVTAVNKISIISGSKKAPIMEAKSIMMYIMRKSCTHQKIANTLGLKNHATVSIKCTQFPGWLEFRVELKEIYNQVIERYNFYKATFYDEHESEIDEIIKAQLQHHELIMYKLNKIKSKQIQEA